MSDAVIVSTARTGLGKSYRGSLNNTHSVDLAGHVIKHAVDRAGIDPAIVEDVIMGAAFQEGAQGRGHATDEGTPYEGADHEIVVEYLGHGSSGARGDRRARARPWAGRRGPKAPSG